MMTEADFSKWCAQINLSPEGIELARLIRTSDPSRRSRGQMGNVCGKYSSRKMGHTVQFDSHTCEMAFIYEAEHNPSVNEYWDQPPAIKISFERQGKRCGYRYTSDFAVFGAENLYFVECKPEELLERAARKTPELFVKDGDTWRCPPAEEALATRGIGFAIWTPDSAPTYARNLAFLQDYYIKDFPEVPKATADEVIGIVSQRRRIRLSELPSMVQALTHDHLNAMILDKQIFVDLYHDVLAIRHNVWVYIDKESAQALGAALECVKAPQEYGPIPVIEEIGAPVKWDGNVLTIAMLGKTMVYLRKGDKMVELSRTDFDSYIASGAIQGTTRTGEHPAVEEVRSAIFSTSTEHIADALRKLKAIGGDPSIFSERTLRRLKKAAKQALEEKGSEIFGLLPNHFAKGNRNPKLPEAQYAIADEVITDVYATSTAPSKRAAHAVFKKKCREQLLDPASYAWFAARTNSRDPRGTLEGREGPRAAYSKFGINFRLYRNCPVHGDHPWDVGHIDHTQLDIEAVLSGGNLRAWLTTFWLSYPRKLVAYYIHFPSPSKVAAMSVMRLCMMKYGRIPTWIVVDNGKEFHGEDFQTLLARMGSNVKYRPPHQARFGSALESAHHALNANLIHNLPGNTKIMKNVRKVTKSFLPDNLANLTLVEIEQKVGAYYDIVNDVLHPALQATPNDYYARGMQQLGERSHMFRPFDAELYILTLPMFGTRKVSTQGIKFMYFHYGNSLLDLHHGEELPVRYDPLDIRHIYVRVEQTWLRCTCPLLADMAARSEAQLRLATVTMRANITGVIKLRAEQIAMRVLPLLEMMPTAPTTATAEEAEFATTPKPTPELTGVKRCDDSEAISPRSTSSESTEMTPENGELDFILLPTIDI